MNASLRLSLVQMRHEGSKDASIDRAIQWIHAAADDRAQVICLQELFATCYPCQSEDHAMFDLAESIPGPTTSRLCEIARERQVVIVVPVFERRAAGVYHNSAAVIDADGTIVGVYRKMHIPDDPLYYEKFYFTPGDLGFRVTQTRFGKLGVGICWDQWFPEAARLFAMAGADVLLYPTAIGWMDVQKDEYGAGQHDAWMTSMRAHAIANGIFLGAPNRVGIEGRIEFWGSSFIVSPRGEVLARGDYSSEQLITADCSLAEIDVVRTHWPFLRDRRIDAYQDLTRRWID